MAQLAVLLNLSLKENSGVPIDFISSKTHVTNLYRKRKLTNTTHTFISSNAILNRTESMNFHTGIGKPNSNSMIINLSVQQYEKTSILRSLVN